VPLALAWVLACLACVKAALHGFERRGWIAVQDRAVTVRQAEALGRFPGN